jgi:hypothetical protein
MPISDALRKEYKKAAKLTDKQIEESVGKLNLQDEAGLARAAVVSAQGSVRQIMVDMLIISARYNEVASKTKKDARETVPPEEIKRDREILESMIADEYHLTNPFGKQEGKAETVNKILSGTIRPDSFGRAGLMSTEHTLQLHAQDGTPHTVVSHGTLKFKGTGLAKFKKSGAVRWRDLTGEYRTTHTYVYRDERWQLAASQMTQVPTEGQFNFIGED